MAFDHGLQESIDLLSWKSFAQGYMDTTDASNLGLHEMAHALRLENGILNGEQHFLEGSVLKEWRIVAEKEMKKINKGGDSLFRKYAGVDRHEFFSVAVENFFEKPLEFSQTLPEVYQLMGKLLNQDPLKLHRLG